MKLLKQDKWWIWLLLLIATQGTSNVILGALTGVFKKDAWYAKIKNWLMYVIPIGLVFILILLASSTMLKNIDIDELNLINTLPFFGFIFMIPIAFFYALGIVLTIFIIQITAQTAAVLRVPGKDLYLSPYIWILFIIIPVIGWIMFIVMILYINIWPTVMLYRGEGEKHTE